MIVNNLFSNISCDAAEELVEQLAGNRHVRIERLVSSGHASPPDFWYDQAEREWVVVLQGEARLEFQEDGSTPNRIVEMKPGDWVNIPPRRKHRVEWTLPNQSTVWLAVFFSGDPANDD
jgi:cupin 2 domain-containing protein